MGNSVTLVTSLSLAAAAVLINIWLAMRIGMLRTRLKISHGDGGDAGLARRIRAQLNFAENVPLTLVLIAVIELSGKGGQWLAIVGAAFIVGRLAHPLGMDRAEPNPLRSVGAVLTMLTQLGLAIVAVLILLGRF